MKLKRLLATALVFALVLTMGAAAIAADISVYNDLPSKDSWNYEAIVSAIENDVFSGENGYIRPGEFITVGQMYTYTGNALGVSLGTPVNSTAIATREDMFVLLAEVLGAELSTLDSVDTYLKGFGDFASISTSARTPIAALIKGGYINGVKSGLTASLYPKNQLSRSEYAVLAHRIFGKYVNTPGTVSGDINGNITVRSSGVTLSGNIITGDLIVGGASGTVDVNLSGATIRGRTIVRGNASLTANSRSTVGIVHSYADLTFSGDATTINVRGKGSNLKLNGGWLRNLNLESDNNVVAISSGTDVAYCSIDGSGNSVTGTGTMGNASLGGSNNKLDVAGANVVSDSGRNNVTNTKTGTFNITGVEITGNTTILVTFDAKIQTAPASAFALSGTARTYTKSGTQSTPDSTSVSGSTVTLTFTGASFLSYNNTSNSATITVTDAVISSEKAKLNTKTLTGGYGSSYYGYDATMYWYDDDVNTTVDQNGKTITVTVASGSGINYVSVPFETNAYSVDITSGKLSGDSISKLTYNNYGGNSGWGGYGYNGAYGYGMYYYSGSWYDVNRDSTGYYYYRPSSSTTKQRFDSYDSNWSYNSSYNGYGSYYGELTISTSNRSNRTITVTSYEDYYGSSRYSIDYTIRVVFQP